MQKVKTPEGTALLLSGSEVARIRAIVCCLDGATYEDGEEAFGEKQTELLEELKLVLVSPWEED